MPWADLENPQSLNLYAYVLNNPLSSFDEDGHFSRDTYVADDDKHGGPHIDRYSNGKNVGRYQPDGTPIKHKGKTPDAVPAADKKKFDKAVEDLQRSEMQGELDRNHVLPPFPQPPIPSALAPDAIPMMNPDGWPPIFIPLPDPLPVPTPLPGPTPFPIPLPEPLPLPYPIFFSGHFPPSVGQPQ